MTPIELTHFLSRLVENEVRISIMIWGSPGIGKSSIVAQIAQHESLQIIDLRLSQLAPTDLRGLPVAENGVAKWFPPEFLPTSGKGILFLDEINMATPAMQGIAQQLILDRQVGSYHVPEGWFIWAAGNRKSDRAAVFEMPSALANRFIHLDVTADFDSFKTWGITANLSEQILAFLAFRPVLLHKIDAKSPSWPSPRSWAMADSLLRAGLTVGPAVGDATSGEFEAFCAVYGKLPDIDDIVAGKSKAKFPTEPSARYAIVLGMVIRADDPHKGAHGLKWLIKEGSAEWVQLYVSDLFRLLRERGQFGEMAKLITADPELRDFAKTMRDLIFS
jgi:hypothetical protein